MSIYSSSFKNRKSSSSLNKKNKEEMISVSQPIVQTSSQNSELTYNHFLKVNTAKGVLKIQAYLGNSVVPLDGVAIEVFKTFVDSTRTFFKGITDENGIIDDIELPAPPKENSLSSGNKNPFATYELMATIGDKKERFKDVIIFDSVKSIQPIKLLG